MAVIGDTSVCVLGYRRTVFPMMVVCLVYVTVVGISDVGAVCSNPKPPEEHTTLLNTHSSNNSKVVWYAEGEEAIYECDGKDGRFGNIHVKCLQNGVWDTKDLRACSDQIPPGSGSIAGIVFAVITIVITVSSIVFSKIQMKNNKSEEDENTAKDI